MRKILQAEREGKTIRTHMEHVAVNDLRVVPDDLQMMWNAKYKKTYDLPPSRLPTFMSVCGMICKCKIL